MSRRAALEAWLGTPAVGNLVGVVQDVDDSPRWLTRRSPLRRPARAPERAALGADERRESVCERSRGTPDGVVTSDESLSLARALTSSCRTRSRVTPNSWPISSSVLGFQANKRSAGSAGTAGPARGSRLQVDRPRWPQLIGGHRRRSVEQCLARRRRPPGAPSGNSEMPRSACPRLWFHSARVSRSWMSPPSHASEELRSRSHRRTRSENGGLRGGGDLNQLSQDGPDGSDASVAEGEELFHPTVPPCPPQHLLPMENVLGAHREVQHRQRCPVGSPGRLADRPLSQVVDGESTTLPMSVARAAASTSSMEQSHHLLRGPLHSTPSPRSTESIAPTRGRRSRKSIFASSPSVTRPWARPPPQLRLVRDHDPVLDVVALAPHRLVGHPQRDHPDDFVATHRRRPQTFSSRSATSEITRTPRVSLFPRPGRSSPDGTRSAARMLRLFSPVKSIRGAAGGGRA